MRDRAPAVIVWALGAVLLGLGIVAVVAAAAAGQQPPGQGTPLHPRLGMNVGQLDYYCVAWAFMDCFKQSKEWANSDPEGPPLDIGPDGYPTSLLPDQEGYTVIYRGIEGHYPSGHYICIYDGTGTIEFSSDCTNVTNPSAGRHEFDIVTPTNGGIEINLVATDPADHLRNIRCFLEEFENILPTPPSGPRNYETEVWQPAFMARLIPFGILRFLNWPQISNSPQVEWSDRNTTDWQTQGREGLGVAWEYVIDICNRLKARPWVCVPHMASDDYMTQMAILFRDTLNPNLNIYVEYSNECWNGQFDQADWCNDQGLQRGYSTRPYEAGRRYQSARSVEMWDIWETVFGSHARFTKVLSGQQGNTWGTQTMLDWDQNYLEVDEFAIAPYFGGIFGNSDNGGTTKTWDVDKLLDECILDINNRIAGNVAAQKAMVDSYGVGIPLITYEAGQGLVGSGAYAYDQDLADLFHAANRAPRMKDVYMDHYLPMWDTITLENTYVDYNLQDEMTIHGAWGKWEWQDQPLATAYKAQAILEWDW